MELILDIDDTKIDSIIQNLEVGRRERPANYTDAITPYWAHHLSLIQVERVATRKIRLTGESGFYFPGMTYSGLDLINTIFKRFGLMRTIAGSEFDLSIPQNGSKKFGYKILGKWISSDYLRSIHHARKIVTQAKQGGISFPDNLRIAEIGSGTGIQALVFKQLFKKSTYFLVDFPETLALAATFLNIVCPEAKILYHTEWKDNPELLNRDGYDFVFVPNYAISHIPESTIHLVINTVSMQEMNYDTIAMYFREIRRILTGPSLFYQSNRDKMMDGVLIEVAKYPYIQEDVHLYQGIDEFQLHTIATRKILGRYPVLRMLKIPVLRKSIQLPSLTKMAKNQK